MGLLRFWFWPAPFRVLRCRFPVRIHSFLDRLARHGEDSFRGIAEPLESLGAFDHLRLSDHGSVVYSRLLTLR